MRRFLVGTAVAVFTVAPGLASAAGDPAAGQRVYNQCRACHVAEQGGPNRVGPNLWGIVGRRAASVEGFRYSANLRELGESGFTWTEENLRAYLTNPRNVTPRGSMAFAGIRNETQLDDLIAYLNTLK
jgi:cytochrome c